MPKGPIYWIPEAKPARLAIVARPGASGNLSGDLRVLRQAGISVLVSLLTGSEARELGLAEEEEIAGRLGMVFVSCPVPDRTVPADMAGFRAVVIRLTTMLREGQSVGIHCRGCIGRSTVLAASIMVALGHRPAEALLRIEEARGWPVPDTQEQRDWILQLAQRDWTLNPAP